MTSLRLHPKHGVNPSVMLCYYCQEPSGVALLGASGGKIREALGMDPEDGLAPREATYDFVPCTKCQEYMQQGIIMISVDESKTTDKKNPYRSGGWVVVKDSAIIEILQNTNPELLAITLKSRVAFVPDDAWERLGLPRGEEDGVHHDGDSKQ